MRFDRIFEDLEGRLDHHEQEEIRAVSEDLARAERAQVTLVQRLRGSLGNELTVLLASSLRLTGTVEALGPDWLVLHQQAAGTRALVPLHALGMIEGLAARARPAEESLLADPSLNSMLRTLARDRSLVTLETTAGSVSGRISAVGAETLDLRTLPTREPGPVPGSTRVTVVTASLLALISS